MTIPNRRLAVGLALLAMTATACRGGTVEVVDAVAEPPVMVDPPAPGGPPPDMGAPDQPGEDGAIQVEPHPEAQGAQPVAWERVSFDREAQALTVYWTSGVEPCTVLDRVDVEYGDAEITVTVLEGAPPEAATISCVMMAQSKKFTVDLDEDPGERRFVDGAA